MYWCVRMGAFLGKSSTNFWKTKQTWIFPFYLFISCVGMSLIYWLPTTGVVNWCIYSTKAHIMVYVLTVPFGMAYGCTC